MQPPSDLVRQATAVIPDLGEPWVRLRGGRVNQIWRSGAVAIKLYRTNRATDLFPNDPAAEAMALVQFSDAGLAPELLAKGEGWIAYRYVPGDTWRSGPEIAAQLLQRLHRQPAGATYRLPSQAAGLETLTRRSLLAAGFRLVSPMVFPQLDVATNVPLHGDPVPGNIVVGADQATLIDWQCPSIGDATHDLAIFLSPAMQTLYRGQPLDAKEVRTFCQSYSNSAVIDRYLRLQGWLHLRIMAHCARRAADGDTDYVAATRAERDFLSTLGIIVEEIDQTSVPIHTPASKAPKTITSTNR